MDIGFFFFFCKKQKNKKQLDSLSLHAWLNNRYKAWSYTKKKYKEIKAYKKIV